MPIIISPPVDQRPQRIGSFQAMSSRSHLEQLWEARANLGGARDLHSRLYDLDLLARGEMAGARVKGTTFEIDYPFERRNTLKAAEAKPETLGQMFALLKQIGLAEGSKVVVSKESELAHVQAVADKMGLKGLTMSVAQAELEAPQAEMGVEPSITPSTPG